MSTYSNYSLTSHILKYQNGVIYHLHVLIVFCIPEFLAGHILCTWTTVTMIACGLSIDPILMIKSVRTAPCPVTSHACNKLYSQFTYKTIYLTEQNKKIKLVQQNLQSGILRGNCQFTLCSSRKHLYPPHPKVTGNFKGVGVSKGKSFKGKQTEV